MSLTASTMMELGTEIPSFALPDVRTGKMVHVPEQCAPGPILVMFICKHCPYVIHVKSELARIGRDYACPICSPVASSRLASRTTTSSVKSPVSAAAPTNNRSTFGRLCPSRVPAP